MVAPPVHGALAPDPSRVTPPPLRSKSSVTALRDSPAARRKEPSWKDEVRERVQKRRRKKPEGELPLFDAPPAAEAPPSAPEPELRAPEPAVVETLSLRGPDADLDQDVDSAFDALSAEPETPSETGPRLLGDESDADEPAPEERESAPEPAAPSLLDDGPLAEEPDLPLRDAEPEVPEIRFAALAPPPEPEREPEPLRAHSPAFDAFDAAAESAEDEAQGEDEWTPHIETEARPVERPASFVDRIEAAAVDVALLLVLDAIVVYFASRTAQAELGVLFHAWPWLVGYLAFLGLAYAVWFTGTTGQTPGKMLFGLRVVETDGQPPGYWRACVRAALGSAGSAALVGALPLFFDPARRALHDRLLRTRVVKF
jgi:uncharacterized RDD family membrane protein YckC